MNIRTDESGLELICHEDCTGAVDWSVLEALLFLQKPGKPDLRRELMKLFVSTLPAQMDRLKVVAGSSDGQELMKVAHSMKSSSMSIGAVRFGRVCEKIEQLGRDNSLEGVPALVCRAEQEFAAACKAFSDALEKK